MKWEPAGKAGGSGTVGAKKPGPLAIAAIAVVVLIVLGTISRCSGGGDSKKSEVLDWPSTGLAASLPKPESSEGSVIANSDQIFSASVKGCDRSGFEAYVSACKDKGFTVEATDGGDEFEAYDEDGAHLKISFYSSSEEMAVNLEAALELGTISWPASGPGALLPAPVSTTGKIESDSSTHFSAKVGEMSADDFAAYVDSCIAAGFSVDYKKGDQSFSADNADGAHVNLSYEGNGVMTVSVDAPDEPAEEAPASEAPAEQAPAAEAPAEQAPAADTSSSSDFRAFMDSYEAFMNEYVDFMNTYNSNSDNVVSMALDYARMMARYNEFMSKYDEIDESSLSQDDLQYYLDVTSRVTARLAEVGQ